MATIYSNKNQLISSNGSQNNLINKVKTQNKLFVASNIFASQYQIKNVHIIDGGSILYEALKNNKMHIIHQVVLWKEDFNTKNIWNKILKLCCLPFIEKVFFQDADYEESIDFQYLSQFLENNDNIKIKIVLQSSFRQQLQINQNQFNLQNILDQFLIILKSFNHLNIKNSGSLQNSIVLRNQITKQFSFYPLDFLIFNKMTVQPLQTLIKLYLISSVSKNIKEYLNFRNKKDNFLFQIYESKLKKSEIKEFIDLLKNVLQNQEKYTQKMLICYIQILRQKYLKNVEQNSMSKYLSNQKLSFQPPQRDNSPNFSNKEKQKQSNLFFQKKPKSFSRKLKIEKQQNQTSEQFRHSYGKKTSSIISMSPNRKNRKYLKYTNTNLFPSSKENLHRSSSASLLLKTTQNFYQNTQNSFFPKNNSIGTPNYQTQNNFLKPDQNQNISLSLKPESQIKSYLQMMGFGNKNLQRASKLNDQNLNYQTNTLQSYHQVSAKQISSVASKIDPNEIKRQSKEMICLNLNDDQKKMRLKQSLSLFEKKRISQNFAVQSEISNKNNFQIQTRNQLRIQQRQEFLKHQKISHKQQSTQIQKNHQPNKQDSIKFNITHQNCMNINIQGTKKQKKLQIQRSTVMVMHFVSFERIQTKEKSTIFKQNTDKSIEENMHTEVKRQKQLSFKPSLASLKKEKIGQKSQRHQKISPNDAQQKLISSVQQKLENKKRQPEQQKTISQNESLAESKMMFKSQKQVLSSINQSSQIQTEHLSKNVIESFQKKQTKIVNSVALSKQFLKQIFLFINSQNKTFVDLLGSKLSYQITFYAFYINYFKLNVTKATTREAIEKMTSQIGDYEGKIMDSQKLSSLEKMLPQFDLFVKRLINLKIQDFMEKYWRRQELIKKEKQSIIRINEQIDSLTVGILKVTLKIIMSRLRLYKTNQKQTIFVLKSLKISSTICQLIYCISNKLLSMTVTEIKKISQIASQNQFGYEKNIINSLSKTQGIIQMYNEKIKQTQTNSQIKIDIPSEIKNIQALLAEVQQK